MKRTFRLLKEIRRVTVEDAPEYDSEELALQIFLAEGILPENAEGIAYHIIGDWNAPDGTTFVIEETNKHINKLLTEKKGGTA